MSHAYWLSPDGEEGKGERGASDTSNCLSQRHVASLATPGSSQEESDSISVAWGGVGRSGKQDVNGCAAAGAKPYLCLLAVVRLTAKGLCTPACFVRAPPQGATSGRILAGPPGC